MKKLSVFLKTPAGVVIAVGVIMLLSELLIMLLVGNVITSFLKIKHELWDFIDPILLIAIVSPALYILILRPMRAQQVKLEQQLDEVRRFQRLSIGRELRMKELVEEIATLHHPLSVEPADNAQLPSGSLEVPRHSAEQPAATQPIEESQRNALLFMLEDLEAGRKKIEQAHQEWVAALDVVNDPIFLHDQEFRILRCNKAYQQRAGIPFHELIGQPYYEVFPKTGAPLASCPRAMEKAEEDEDDEEVAFGGVIYRSRAFSIHDEQGVYLYSIHALEDITESKRAEEALSESNERNKATLAAIPDVMFRIGSDGVFLDYKPSEQVDLYAPPDVFLGKRLDEVLPPDVAKTAMDHIEKCVETCIVQTFEYQLPIKNEMRNYEARLALCGKDEVVAIIRDITERKQAEEEIKEGEEKYRSIYENTQVGLYRTRVSDGKLIMVNDAMAKMFGFDSIEEATAKYITSEHYVDLGTRERLLDILRKYGKFDNFEARLTRNDGIIRWFQYSGQLIQNKGYIEGVATDITERKQAEAAIQHANRALATLSAVDHTLVHASNEDELLQAICQAIVQQRGYRLAWVGYVQHDESKSIKIMARAGHDEGYLDNMQITWAESEHGMGPSGRAIRSGTTQLCQDIANDPLFLLWRDAAPQHGYAASIALPLINGEVFGILNVYAEEVNAFSPAEIALLEEMAGDLAFGVRSLHTRRERDLALVKNQYQLVQLQDSLEDTVRAIATIVEMRDPYTAGHQIRVADLAAAIAKQMGLPDEQVHAIHLAGIVHDLGKIQIPAEILSKPGKITDIEFSLIKIHAQAGYEILKDINFPWPIAQMVLQHHERLDGSGYPRGLKGDAILIEARILSVADVVEAMSSHRPYRPGLGIETALAEITKQRGIYFDPQVVDACLALFREQHYSFKS